MAISNKERITRALDLLREGLSPFVERMMRSAKGAAWVHEFNDDGRLHRNKDGSLHLDNAALLRAMAKYWGEAFSQVLGRTERTLVHELIDLRNRWAHDRPFTNDDSERALDSIRRLLEAVSARAQAEAVEKSRYELRRSIFEEESRNKTRYAKLAVEGSPKSGLKPWREIVTPHRDVASGRYAQAEFAADLAQVHRGEAAAEYGDPQEFYRRTFLTEGLQRLLRSAMLRLAGEGGDPVVELQTNFGGGKTHSMLALYHLAGAADANALAGVEEVMSAAGLSSLPRARRAVLVGTALSPGQPSTKPDGTVVRTLWGELAWQLGGTEGYTLIAQSDANGVSPGSDVLTGLLQRFSPCLVLIDEWVAYVRQLYHVSGMPGGSFDANLTFAQALTEAVKAAKGAMVVASLPASQIEIGGEGGQQALDRLKNTFSRLESSWQPATADEGFEIVRRRLFEPVADRDLFAARDAVIKAFSDMYRAGGGEFPQGSGEAEYRRRMEKAYPIHPELFDRLYNDWGTLDKFQRTRGVLRLMASVIYTLWEREDRSLMILPASIPIDHSGVQSELVRYLEPGWPSVIASDIDGPTSVPLAVDQEVPTLGRYSATRRVARTVYVGSAATFTSGKNPGIDDRRIRLGCVQPGETPATFGDALRRLADRATYLYQDGARYWFSTQPSVARLADDRAAQQDPHEVDARIVDWLREDRSRGAFNAVHVAPNGSADVPDEMEARLVVLGPDYPHVKAEDSRAVKAAEEILNNRGTGQRIYRNTLIFLAPDAKALPNLLQAMRLYRAWSSIADEHEALNLDAFQRKQAETRKKEFKTTIEARILETWVWTLVPDQPNPQDRKIEWNASRVQGGDPIVVRASKKVEQDDSLLTRMGPARLKLELDKHLWTNANHVNTRKLWEWMASYLYLPRLTGQEVLRRAIEAGISELVCDHFAYAGRYDEATGRYEGLKLTGGGQVVIDGLSLLVKPAVAKAQQDADQPSPGGVGGITGGTGPTGDDGAPTGSGGGSGPTNGAELLRRFYGTVEIDADRAGRDAGRIAEEILQHLTTLPSGKVKVTIDIEAEIPNGASEDVQRIVTENCVALKFRSHGFETT